MGDPSRRARHLVQVSRSTPSVRNGKLVEHRDGAVVNPAPSHGDAQIKLSTMARPSETWLGAWRLDPGHAALQRGRPGRRTLYATSATNEGLTFVDADDPDREAAEPAYGGPLDSVGRDIGGGALLDAHAGRRAHHRQRARA